MKIINKPNETHYIKKSKYTKKKCNATNNPIQEGFYQRYKNSKKRKEKKEKVKN